MSTLHHLPMGSHTAVLTDGLFREEDHHEQEELMQLPSHSLSYLKSHGNQVKAPVTGKREASHSQQGGWTRWFLKVPFNPNCSAVLTKRSAKHILYCMVVIIIFNIQLLHDLIFAYMPIWNKLSYSRL